ncbi:MAG: NADH-quinone oxidoreductase subunit C [Nitrososphaerota archaeon]|nr:NADH-quinone oxidoreductase subunit C [Nitrososphaerota archaeon]
MKDDEALRLVQAALGALGEVSAADRNRLRVRTTAEKLPDAAARLKAAGFDYMQTIIGTDYPATGELELCYVVGSVKEGMRNNVAMVFLRLPKERPVVGTLKDVWPAALLFEREEWEMLGIRFEGNPDLKPLYLPEDWNEIPPLLKDYRLKRWVEDERRSHGLVVEHVEHE